MNISKIVSNSFKYPFRNIKKLPILFVLFILVALIPIGMVSDNRYVLVFGIVAFFLFILIVPGYLLSIVSFGLNESSMFPSISFGKNIYNSIRLLLLRIAYMIVPTVVFFIVWATLGVSGIEMFYDLKVHGFLLAIIIGLLIVLIVYVLFEIFLFFAKARLAYLDSLSEALKVHEVIKDIKNIGVANIIKWLITMAILMVVISFVSSWVMAIPYVGFIVYLGIVIPILESIGNYSLGLLYSNIAEKEDELDKFERELDYIKYKRIN